jgi:hypothetical protein
MTGLINAYIADAKAVSRWIVKFTRWCRHYWPLGIFAFPVFLILCWIVIRIPMLYVESVSKSYSSGREGMRKYSIDRNPYLYIPVSFYGRRFILRTDFIDPYNFRMPYSPKGCEPMTKDCTLAQISMTFYYDAKRGDFCTAGQYECPVSSNVEDFVKIDIFGVSSINTCFLEYSKTRFPDGYKYSEITDLARSFSYDGICYGYGVSSYGSGKYAKPFGEPGGFLERYLTALETGNYDWIDK